MCFGIHGDAVTAFAECDFTKIGQLPILNSNNGNILCPTGTVNVMQLTVISDLIHPRQNIN